MDADQISRVRGYSFVEIALLDICDRPLKPNDRFMLLKARLLILLTDIAERFGRRQQEPTCRARADSVRQAIRVFSRAFSKAIPDGVFNGHFPEILSQLETCPLCNQETLLLVHPDMICDGCWLRHVALFQQAYRELKDGKALEEVMSQLSDRMEELLRGTAYDTHSSSYNAACSEVP